MAREVPFIGRGRELAQIEKLIGEWRTLRVVCISGSGGIGKTRLLKEIHQRFSGYTDTPVLMPGVNDFDDIALHIPENVDLRIARSLGEKSFGDYFRELRDWRGMQSANLSVEKLEEQGAKVLQTLVEDFNKVTANRRVVLRYDTIEKLDWEVWSRHVDLIHKTKNALYIIAGREVQHLLDSLRPKLGKSMIHIELEPLETKSGKEYLEKKQELMHITIEPRLTKKLLFLAGGRPILLDLATEWTSRRLPPDWITEKSLSMIKSLPPEEIEEMRKELKIQLVHHIRQIRSPMDQLTLIMSRVYPLNREMIAELLKISGREADALFKEAVTYVFVKQPTKDSISLHDEMREMIMKHVWPEVDQDSDRRRRDSELAASYLKSEIKALAERSDVLAEQQRRAVREKNTQRELNTFIEREEVDRELWALREQFVFHSLFTDIKAGVQDFVQVFDEAFNKGRFSLLNILLKQAEEFREQFSAEDAYEIDIRRVSRLLDERRMKEARQALDSLKERYVNGDEREVDVLTRLARLEGQQGNLPQAINLFEKASEICKNEPKLRQEWLGPVLNSLGLMNRRMGKWEAAEQNYHESLDFIRATGDQIKLASAYNNLGFIVGLRSDYESALRYCHQALKLQERLNLRYDSGRTHNTLGIIFRGKEDFLSSLEHTNQAIAIFHEFKDKKWLSRAYCELGGTKWHMHQPVLLPEANADLEKSYQLSKEIDLTSEQVVIIHRKGHVAWELGKMKEAEKYFKESARLADQIHDIYQLVNNLEGLVELYYAMGEKHHKEKEFDLRDKWYDKATELAEEWKSKYEDEGFYFPLYSGSRHRILGNMAYDRENYEEALSCYMEAYPRMASRGGYSKYALTEYLDLLQDRIDWLPHKIALEWCDKLKSYWKEEKYGEDFPEMISLCDICRDNAKQRAKGFADNGGES